MTDYYLSPALYDLVYADIRADIAPHVAAARAAGGPVLEVCCGNGRVLLPMLEAGVPCEGLDRDEAMLADLRERLAAKGLRAELHAGDMRDFALARKFAMVLIPFDSFLHNLTQDDQIATLRRCREHLAPGGCVELAIFHPSAEKLIEWNGVESFVKELPLPDGGRLRMHDRADDDRIEQIRHMTRRLDFVAADGHVLDEQRMTFDLRYIFKPEMELLLRVAGFRHWQAEPLYAVGWNDALAPSGQGLREGDQLRWRAWAAHA